jgi:hypothetical protein
MSIVGPLFDQAWVAYAMSWAGAVFDLTIVGWLLWHRTRFAAYVAVIGFHGMTGLLFHIGLFPWIMITATLLFFPPDWPRRLVRAFGERALEADSSPSRPTSRRWPRRLGITLVAGYFAVQLLVPLRRHLYPGRAAWTGEGFNFAWNVMLVEKTGRVEFIVQSRESDREWTVEPSDYLTPLQVKMMSTQPHLIQRFAHDLGRRFRDREQEEVASLRVAERPAKPAARRSYRRPDEAADQPPAQDLDPPPQAGLRPHFHGALRKPRPVAVTKASRHGAPDGAFGARRRARARGSAAPGT